MYTCIFCHFQFTSDDAMCPTPSGRCICLLCFQRQTGTYQRMDKALRRELSSTLDALPAGLP